MNKNNIFSGLEHLGFNDIKNVTLYEDNSKSNVSRIAKTESSAIQSLTYTRTVACPVCDREFKAISLKSSAYKLIKKDSDFFAHYELINPYFYDVWVCNHCGYSSLKSEFNKISYAQTELVKSYITPKWKGREYPETFNVDIAIERYKLALLNYMYINAKDSVKAMNCLKIAWMYRLKDSTEQELVFISESVKGFEKAFFSEQFPLFSMDKFSTMYLIGELYRRIDNFDSALKWFNDVVINPNAKPKIKELAREQRLLVKSALNAQNYNTNPGFIPSESNSDSNDSDSKSFFQKLNFFNKK